MTEVSPSSSFFARFITGFCGGMFVLAAPAYSSEVAEARYRGALGSIMQVMVCTLYSAVQYRTANYSLYSTVTVKYNILQYSTAPSCMQVMVCLGMLFVNINCDTDWRGGG